MCRLLGYVTRTPTTLAQLLGEAELHEFTELSCKHGDGWGFAWATADGVEVRKSPDAARESQAFARHAHEHTTDLGLVHLRWATLGLSVVQENTHPFTDGTIAFAHNGSIRPPSSLDALIPADLQARRLGTTDSERYFLATLAGAEDADPAEALADTVDRIAYSLQFSGLNALIATPEQLIAVCRYDPVAQAMEDEPDYYQLRYRVTREGVVISSSGWGAGWRSLENGELLTVQRGTLDVSVRSLAEAQLAG
ncbi:class II glutamine amidotransferase [Planotetraspora kaengkrachanensis]|uniref:Class II glutamine amidotransferase n=1 Tax=Planotetraspora kaengkrachanensis TaxID=575193 RepID=A0A8J3M655_9ACTN|nr:class II glutamine amidotransferase [Planotetraspora kaengkrachanensis]GIG80065.1 class II glutamine amidotransferase [Planotetraspora kaengkrachanensis]